MENIYIVFSKTNTKIGWIVRKVLRYKYNHVSVCLNNKMYSFGRKYYQLPFVGGFTEENIYNNMYPKDTLNIRIFKISITHNQMLELNEMIEDLLDENTPYLYNLLTPINVLFKKEIKLYRTHTCVTFIIYLLRTIGINIDTKNNYNCESSITPEDLNEILKCYGYKDSIIFKKNLNKDTYKLEQNYLKKFSFFQRVNKTISFIISLNDRVILK
ncbi:MAG: hypothetical protein VB119_09580 [Candidatus Metalachnospira sp.]|nr:hypothetical protein [Bacteroidaceae bacterium]MEA4973410.1 hypothetical protein [Candidatus Metalachnospira sp.]